MQKTDSHSTISFYLKPINIKETGTMFENFQKKQPFAAKGNFKSFKYLEINMDEKVTFESPITSFKKVCRYCGRF